jgi:AraC-like DNA-binding protein
MLEATYESFAQSPAGRFTVTGSSFVWCASPSLCGTFLWGQQTESETRGILQLFDRYDLHMAGRFDVVLDSRGVERVDPRLLAILFSWLVAHREPLTVRIGLQVNVLRQGPIGFLLAGLLPVVGQTHPVRIFTNPADAFRSVDNDTGLALAAEVDAIAERVRGVSPELRAMRAFLEGRAKSSLREASRALGTSPRSLQRVLTRHGTSFHQEMSEARFTLAKEILRHSDQKLAAISARVGISERSLTLLFKAKTGLTPAEWRKQDPA